MNRLLAVCLVSLGVASLAACGGGGAAPKPHPTPEAQPQPEAPAQPEAKAPEPEPEPTPGELAKAALTGIVDRADTVTRVYTVVAKPDNPTLQYLTPGIDSRVVPCNRDRHTRTYR